MADTSEYDIANTAKNAIVNGIDANGNLVAEGTTPAYGGTSSGEDFYAQNASGSESFNVYSFQGEDDMHDTPVILTPCIFVTVEGHPASNQIFNQEVKAVTVTWYIQIGMFDGWVTPDSTQLKEAKAMMVWRNRIITLLDKMNFSGISLLEYGDTEPLGISPSDGEGDAGDNMIWISGASKYMEYVEDD